MHKKLPLFIITISSLIFLQYNSNPPDQKTLAPGEGYCGDPGCHGGGSFTPSVDVTGLPSTVMAGITYTLTLTVTGNGAAAAGFQLTALDASNNKAGALSAGPGSQISTTGGRQFIDQAGKKTITGGTASWTFNWTAPASGSGTITMYFVGNGVNNNGGTSGDKAVTSTITTDLMGGGSPLTASISIINHVSCNGGNDGTAEAVADGGTAPYTYAWSNGATTAMVSNLTAGAHKVTVTDNNGTKAVANTTITQPTAVTLSATNSGKVTCSTPNVTLTATGGGGTQPYTYEWSNGGSSASIMVNEGGTYGVTLTDNKGCTKTASTTVIQDNTPPTAVAGPMKTLYCDSTTTSLDGTGSSTGNGISYLWTTGNGKIISGGNTLKPKVQAGTYTLLVSNASNGCSNNASTTVDKIPAPKVALDSVYEVRCHNDSNGVIRVKTIDGSSPFNYAWSNGKTGNLQFKLKGGLYIISVTDNENCTDTAQITLLNPVVLDDTLAIVHESSSGAKNGSITCTPSGGTAPYTYLWNTGATTSMISNLAPGTYAVTITDSHACKTSLSGTVNQFGCTISATASVLAHVNCNGESNGSAKANPNGGTGNITYKWNDPAGQTTATASNLKAGNYIVTLTDASNCSTTAQVTINEPTPLLANISSTNPSGAGMMDGTASVNPSGSNPPYVISWSNGANTLTIGNLSKGTYCATITDNNGCKKTDCVTLIDNCTINASAAITHVLCAGGSNGAIQLSMTCAKDPLTILWSNGNTTLNPSSLSAGDYSVTVTDQDGQIFKKTYTVDQPNILAMNFTGQSPSSPGGNDGQITCNGAGGTQPYSYQWANGATTQTITGLETGTYCVTITDKNNCTMDSCWILKACTISGSGTVTNALCAGEASGSIGVNVNCVKQPITILWSNGVDLPFNQNLKAGKYSVTVTDANNQIYTEEFMVGEPAPLAIKVDSVKDQHDPNLDGAIHITPTGGTGTYTYEWSKGGVVFNTDDQDVTGLSAGTYKVVLTDVNGCEISLEIEVKVISATGNPDEATGLLIHPNPVSDNLHLKILDTKTEMRTIQIYDINGHEEFMLRSSEQQFEIPVQSFTSGIYLIAVTGNNTKEFYRFMKK